MNGEAKDSSKEEARNGSYGCLHCSGAGMTTVYHKRYTGHPTIEVEGVHRGEIRKIRIAATVGAHCICPMGRWMRARTPEDLLRRIPDLIEVLGGSRTWQANDPTEIPADVRPMTPQQARARVNEVFAKV